MSDAPVDATPSPDPAEAPVAPPRRWTATLVVTVVGVVVVLAGVGASPFWAPAVMQFLPWGAAPPMAPAPAAAPAASDPALAAVKAQAAQNAASLAQLGQRIGVLEARPAPDLSATQQQLAALTKTTGDLAASIAALQKAAQTQPAADPNLAALALVLLQIREAVDIARPFAAEYQTLVLLARDRPEVAAAAAPLAGPAASGVPSRAALAERLRQLAPQIATARPPANADWRSQVLARLGALVTIRRIDGAAQSPAEAAVSTAQRDLASGDLDGAIAALGGLSGPSQAAAAPWLDTARQRLAVETALHQLDAAVAGAVGGAVPPGKS